MRLIGPIRGPLRLAAVVGEGVLEVALSVVREMRSALGGAAPSEPAPSAFRPPARQPEARVAEPGLFDRTGARKPEGRQGPGAGSRARKVPARTPDVPARPAARPPPPPLPDEAKIVDDEAVLVAEFGEAGAEEDAGAQVSVDEPWKGYDRMNVPAVKKRLATAGRELVGAVVLYESFGKKRSSIAQAAERRLKQLSRPGS